jgi:hypothetical protein
VSSKKQLSVLTFSISSTVRSQISVHIKPQSSTSISFSSAFPLSTVGMSVSPLDPVSFETFCSLPETPASCPPPLSLLLLLLLLLIEAKLTSIELAPFDNMTCPSRKYKASEPIGSGLLCTSFCVMMMMMFT